MPAHTVSNRKKTILGSRKLHRVYRKIMSNKALTVALMAIVAPLVGLLMTSKGMPTPHYEELRKMLTKLPFGKFLGKLIQQLVDVVRRIVGIGIRQGDVVQLRDTAEDNTCIRKKSLEYANGDCLPLKDVSCEEILQILPGAEFVVYRIRNRQLQLIIIPPDETEKKKVTQYSVEELTEMSYAKLKENGIPLITYHALANVISECIKHNSSSDMTIQTLFGDTALEADTVKKKDVPYGFTQENFERADFQLDLTYE